MTVRQLKLRPKRTDCWNDGRGDRLECINVSGPCIVLFRENTASSTSTISRRSDVPGESFPVLRRRRGRIYGERQKALLPCEHRSEGKSPHKKRYPVGTLIASDVGRRVRTRDLSANLAVNGCVGFRRRNIIIIITIPDTSPAGVVRVHYTPSGSRLTAVVAPHRCRAPGAPQNASEHGQTRTYIYIYPYKVRARVNVTKTCVCYCWDTPLERLLF